MDKARLWIGRITRNWVISIGAISRIGIVVICLIARSDSLVRPCRLLLVKLIRWLIITYGNLGKISGCRCCPSKSLTPLSGKTRASPRATAKKWRMYATWATRAKSKTLLPISATRVSQPKRLFSIHWVWIRHKTCSKCQVSLVNHKFSKTKHRI